MQRMVVVLIGLLLGILSPVYSQMPKVVFEGLPIRKVVTGFDSTARVNLNEDQAFEYQVRIVERKGEYYWASRDMKPLVRFEAPGFVTFLAVDGSGYVRVGTSHLYEGLDKLPLQSDAVPRQVGYWEHLVFGFSSIDYYGKPQ